MTLLNDPLILTGIALISIGLGRTVMFVVGAICIALAVFAPFR